MLRFQNICEKFIFSSLMFTSALKFCKDKPSKGAKNLLENVSKNLSEKTFVKEKELHSYTIN